MIEITVKESALPSERGSRFQALPTHRCIFTYPVNFILKPPCFITKNDDFINTTDKHEVKHTKIFHYRSRCVKRSEAPKVSFRWKSVQEALPLFPQKYNACRCKGNLKFSPEKC